VRGAGFGEAGCYCGAYAPACSCDEDCLAGEVLLGGVDGGIGGVVDGGRDGEVACWVLGKVLCCGCFGVGRLVSRYLVLRWDSGCLVMAALVYWF
jgi:hypothetical protein